MKKSKRIMGIVLSLIMVLFIFAACSGNKSARSNDTSVVTDASLVTEKESKPVTLRFMWWGGDERHNNTLAMIETYKTARPNVTIEAEYSGWDGYEDKLTTQLASGTAADVMQVSYSWLQNLQLRGGFFEDISKHPELLDLGMFSSSVLNSYCKVNNEIVALPAGISGNAFIINKNTLTKAGLALDEKWTWDDVLEAAKKVHALGDDYYLTRDGDKNVLFMSYFYQYIRGRTGRNLVNDDFTIGFSRDDAIEALTYVKTLDENRAWPPLSEISGAADRASDPNWIEGRTAACMSQWVSSFLGDVQAIADSAGDVQVFPVLKDGRDTAIMVSPSMHLCVYSQGENVDESVKLLNYMFTGEEAIKALGTCRGIPSSSKALEVAQVNKLIDPMVAKCLKLATDNASEIQFSPNDEDSELGMAAADVIEMMLFDKFTPNTAADELISRFNTRLAEMKAAQ